MLFSFAEITEHGNFELLERNCLEERKHVSHHQKKLLLQELEHCCEHLCKDHNIFHLGKMDGLTAHRKSDQTCQSNLCFCTSVCLLVWMILKLLPDLLRKWEWGNTKNFLHSYQGEVKRFNNRCYTQCTSAFKVNFIHFISQTQHEN